MNFLIDLGNSNCKVAFEEGGILKSIKRSSLGEDIDKFILEAIQDARPQIILFSNVREEKPGLVEQLKKRCEQVIVLDYKTPLPHDLNYQFPAEGLGADRIAGALATAMLFPGKDCIKFDFGTALTVDFIDKKGTFLGGNISLGLTTRFRALNTFTKRLPLIQKGENLPDIGVDTEGAMTAGVVFGLIFEVEGYIKKYPEHIVVFTGGDSFYFAERMKSAIFVVPNLVLNGLAQITNYYASRKD